MNSEPVRILYMEDDAALARLMQKRLALLGYQVSIACDGQQGLEMAAAGEYDLLAIDYNMPVLDGIQVLSRLAASGPLLPTIMITGTGSEELAVEALKLGARDYLVKDLDTRYLTLLPAVIERVLHQAHLEQEKQAADVALRLAHQSEHEQRVLAEALRDTAAALNSTLDLEQVLDAILSNVRQVESHDYANIMLLDEHGVARIVRQAGLSAPEQVAQLVALRFVAAQTATMRQMLETCQPLIISDTAASPIWETQHTLYPVLSYAGMPIVVQGKVMGLINLDSSTPNFFTSAHIDTLRAFADQAGIAFTNARLVSELRRANEQLQEQIDQIQALQSKLRQQALRDPLTNLYNRYYLQDALTRDIARAGRARQPVSAIIMDIDYFKSVNDRFGHAAGDLLLRKFAELIQSLCRQADFVCRYGGEEFVVIMPGASLPKTLERAELIRSRFEALRVPFDQHLLHATVSLGIAIYPQHTLNSEDLLILADRALYRAKREGRNRVVTYQDEVSTPPPPKIHTSRLG